MGMGFGFALAGAAQGLGTGIIEEAARKREDALRAAEQEREDRIRAEERQWELEDRDHRDSREDLIYGRNRGDAIEDREEARSYDERQRQRAVQDLTDFITGSEEEGYTLTGNAAAVGQEIVAGFSNPDTTIHEISPDQLKGLTDGVLGNIWVESKFVPTAEGDHEVDDGEGLAYNQGQWRGERYQNLKRKAAEWGMDESDPRLAGRFFHWEVNGGDPYETEQFKKVLAENPQTPEEWAYSLARHYWRPAEPANPERQRAAAAFATVLVDGHMPGSTATALAEEQGIVPKGLGDALGGSSATATKTSSDGYLLERQSDGSWDYADGPDGGKVRVDEPDDDDEVDIRPALKSVEAFIDETSPTNKGVARAEIEAEIARLVSEADMDARGAGAVVLEAAKEHLASSSDGYTWESGFTVDGSATADTADAGAGAEVGKPITEAEYNALPKGAQYQHPDDPPGTLRTKG